MYDEIAPVISKDGSTMFFTRVGDPSFNRTLMDYEKDLSKEYEERMYLDKLRSVYSELSEERVSDPIKSPFNQDVWIAHLSDKKILNVQHPGFPLNSALPNSICSLTPDSNKYIIINQFRTNGDMARGFSFIQQKENGEYTFPEPLHILKFYTNSADVSLTMSKDEDVLIISLDREDSKGGNDLYVCFKLRKNLWSAPINLGPIINTKNDEITPFLSKDKRRLYFASNRKNSLGGRDIYLSHRKDYSFTKWTKPEQLAEPINSPYDDHQPYFNEETGYFYLASKRDGTSDIYRLRMNTVEELEKPIIVNVKVVNAATNRLTQAELYYGPSEIKDYLEYFHTYTGGYQFKIEKNEVFKLRPFKRGFTSRITRVDPNHIIKQGKEFVELTLYVHPKAEELSERPFARKDSSSRTLNLKNIYFERTKSVILRESYKELDRIAQILMRNKEIKIQVEGHTDNVGDPSDLMALSEERTVAVKKYFIKKGIDGKRIKVIGYGATRPLMENSSEAKKWRNRRVEIKVIDQ
ncbi:MAG: OmpA family protein [Bacteroidota bacterium]